MVVQHGRGLQRVRTAGAPCFVLPHAHWRGLLPGAPRLRRPGECKAGELDVSCARRGHDGTEPGRQQAGNPPSGAVDDDGEEEEAWPVAAAAAAAAAGRRRPLLRQVVEVSAGVADEGSGQNERRGEDDGRAPVGHGRVAPGREDAGPRGLLLPGASRPGAPRRRTPGLRGVPDHGGLHAPGGCALAGGRPVPGHGARAAAAAFQPREACRRRRLAADGAHGGGEAEGAAQQGGELLHEGLLQDDQAGVQRPRLLQGALAHHRVQADDTGPAVQGVRRGQQRRAVAGRAHQPDSSDPQIPPLPERSAHHPRPIRHVRPQRRRRHLP
mmetsp:Transcript_49394/g.147517  ORF Transcript_49394/g.147517 Transcript_49394/m.147517 type:complete len:326 (+) Transcript_49394:981-1958(+)